jgi:hypothetical protein
MMMAMDVTIRDTSSYDKTVLGAHYSLSTLVFEMAGYWCRPHLVKSVGASPTAVAANAC